jgi:hypothetical protein
MLIGVTKLQDYTIFERMAWARHRMTSGLEDQAYCLLGLFEVEMTLDYGESLDTEGSNAFLRLREAIKQKHGSDSLDQPAAPLRLLCIDSLEVESHPVRGEPIPEYAILSHTWDGKEITYQDMQFGTTIDERKQFLERNNKRSYDKIMGCCKLAEKNNFKYVWIDTCCIDRTSSSELQEAICSMWRWYKNAKKSVFPVIYCLELFGTSKLTLCCICYAFLVDYKAEQDDSLWACKWFGRGWTLRKFHRYTQTGEFLR